MVRNYKRTTNIAQYSTDDLSKALTDISNGKSVNSVSKTYKIPHKTLRRHRDQKVKNPGVVCMGRYKTAFDSTVEKEILGHVTDMEKRMFGLTTYDIRRLAYDVAENLKIPHPFSKTSKIAGKDWLKGFMKRHSLSVRVPQATSMTRLVGFNKPKVDNFFSIYKEILTKFEFRPSTIWNMDETGVTTVQKPTKVVTEKGKKQVGKVTSGERGELVTTLCCMNAVGNFIPPMFIFPRKIMRQSFMEGSPPQSIGDVSDSGWTDGKLFFKWLQHFVTITNCTKDSRHLIILDGHHSHKTLDSVNFCRDNGIELVTLPPHSSHKLQPLDCSYFKSLKAAYNLSADNWMISNPGKRMTIYNIAGVFGKAYIRTASAEIAINGFRVTGIWPFDDGIFTAEDFMAADLTEEAQPEEEAQPGEIQSEEAQSDVAQPEEAQTMDAHTMDAQPVEAQEMEAEPVIIAPDLQLDTSVREEILKLSPTPKISAKRKRSNRCESSSHLTSTPSKKSLEEKSLSQMKKNVTKKTGKVGTTKSNTIAGPSQTKGKGGPAKSSKNITTCREIISDDSTEDEEWPCLVCCEPFANSRSSEKWIQCLDCKKWAHVDCTDGNRLYYCQNCDSD